jgi:hypothetical protein
MVELNGIGLSAAAVASRPSAESLLSEGRHHELMIDSICKGTLALELAAREVSRGNRGRRRAPRERERSEGIRRTVEAASGRADCRCAEGADSE